METIEVRYSKVIIKGVDTGAYHKYYVYTDSGGKEFAARGGSADGGPFSGWSFPPGYITTEHGPYDRDFPDWDPEGDDPSNPGYDPREFVGEGDDLSKKWEDVKRTMDDIEREKHRYTLPSPNSNTTLDTTSKRTGLRETQLDGPGGLNTPGSDADIRDPIERLIDDVKDLYRRARDAIFPPRRDPLILDLDGDGFETSGTNTTIVHFDHDGDGFAEATGWIGADDGLLALDRNANGSIDDGSELFGDQTPLSSGSKAANGFQALAQYDGNADGRIDANDSIWADLKIWNDRDGNGLSWQGELFNLSDFNITSISLVSSPTNLPDGQGNTQSRIGSFEFVGGTTGQIGEYQFTRDMADAVTYNDLPVPSDIAALPNADGYGKIYDLHQAMVRDSSGQLKLLIETFIAQTDPAARATILEQILYKWTGADKVATNARGPNMDARKLVALEKFMGEGFVGSNGVNPAAGSAVLLNEAYRGLAEMVYGQIMGQTQLKDLYSLITYSFDPIKQKIVFDTSSVITQLQTELVNNPDAGKLRLSEFSRTLRGLGLQDTVNYLAFRETFINSDPSFGWLIDTGGLPVTPPKVGGGHYLGTDRSEAMQGSPTAGDGYLNTYSGEDVIYGTDRTEHLIQELGKGVLVGGGGNDKLWAGADDDLLDGGPGNDELRGEAGNDTYLFRRGSGQDTLIDSDATPGNLDTLWFGSHLTPGEIAFLRHGFDMEVVISGTSDRLTIKDYFRSTLNRIERFAFEDGTVWTETEVLARLNTPTESDDIFYGGSGDDNLSGLGGQDLLIGLSGNDVFDGGNGNDILVGGDLGYSVYLQDSIYTNDIYLTVSNNSNLVDSTINGNDTYLFGKGRGQDIVIDRDATPGNLDTIELTPEVTPTDVLLTRVGSDLKLSFLDTADTLTVRNWFAGDELPEWRVEQIRFADGTVGKTNTIQRDGLPSITPDDTLPAYAAGTATRRAA